MLNHREKYELLELIAREHDYRSFVETGIWQGMCAAVYLAHQFDNITVIDIDPLNCEMVQVRLPQAHVFVGDSGEIMPTALSYVRDSSLFWLDAHRAPGIDAVDGERNCPLLEELESVIIHAISGSYDHCILIDDMGLMDGRYGYPTRGQIVALVKRCSIAQWRFSENDEILRLEYDRD